MKQHRFLAAMLIILALLLSACGGSQPQNALETVKQRGVLKVGMSADYPPFQYVDKNGAYAGYDVDVETEIAKRLGVKLEIVDVPFDTLFTALQEGKFDIADGAHAYTEERAKIMEFPTPIFTTTYGLLVKDTFDESQLKTIADIGKFKVGQQTGAIDEKWMRENLVDKGLMPESNLTVYERVDSLALDVKAGRVDIHLNKDVVLYALVKELGGLKVIILDGLPKTGVNISVKKGEVEFRDALSKIINDLRNEGLLDQFARKNGMIE